MTTPKLNLRDIFGNGSKTMPRAGNETGLTFSAYCQQLTQDKKETIQKLDHLITETVPMLKRYMHGTIIGYGKYTYTYASGRSGEWMVVGLASNKSYFSLYLCLTKNGNYLPEIYADRLGNVNVGKSCIRFKNIEHLHIPTTKKLLRETEKIARANNFTFAHE